jgi:hypothetical protein
MCHGVFNTKRYISVHPISNIDTEDIMWMMNKPYLDHPWDKSLQHVYDKSPYHIIWCKNYAHMHLYICKKIMHTMHKTVDVESISDIKIG